MPQVVPFNASPSLQDCLEVIDAFRKDVEEGKIIVFAICSLDPEDETVYYCGAVKPVKKSRLLGCLAQTLHSVAAGEFGT
jgi:hypothetical protein